MSIKKHWQHIKTWQQIGLGLGLILVLFIVFSVGVQIYYANKILPGVKVRGVAVGGLTPQEAEKVLNEKTQQYLAQPINIQYGSKTISTQPSDLGLSYDNHQITQDALDQGRDSNVITNIANQTLLILGLYSQDDVQANFDQEKLSSFLVARDNETATPAQNASYVFKDGELTIVPNIVGARLDLGESTIVMGESVSRLQPNISLVISQIEPDRNQSSLERQKASVESIIANQINLSHSNKSWQITQQQLLDWLVADSSHLPAPTNLLQSYYKIPSELSDFKLERSQVVDYLNSVAKEVDQEPVDAQLTVSAGKVVVAKPSHSGQKLDTNRTAELVMQAINNKQTTPVALVVNTTKAEVGDDIASLGLNELISEGVTYFPGSPANRLQNVRVGQSKFNGVLLKPNQVFSFGEILGDVGPEQGYTPGLIILGDHEEKAYGGGLCQVSSTAYRAALLAGLPILQRTNHAFAISYYTAPFGVPGVDATIYYPQVDMKFRNDTGHYILIQTEMVGTTLKFRYYGTKTKSGEIRGPFYVTGSSDATKPSQTVFYRDVKDLSGNVVKTDTINTYYQSSLDFPITD